MSSDRFHLLQKTIRDIHSIHGIDLSNPNGVTVDGRPYPAMKKHINMGVQYSFTDNAHDFSFDIPIENGSVLRVNGENYDTEDGPESRRYSQLLVPTIHFNKDGTKSYRHGTALHVGADAFWNRHTVGSQYDTVANLHDVINEYSRLPHQGTYDWDYSKEGTDAFRGVRPHFTSGAFGVHEEHLKLNPEELQEHRNNYKFNPYHSGQFLSTSFHNEPADDVHHRYDLRTEQLVPMSEKDLPNNA